MAYLIRPMVTDEVNRVYFFPALTVRIIGALAVGLIYQFYYHGGDTYNFHTYGSRYFWEAFLDSPSKFFDMLFSDGKHNASFYKYSSQIYFFSDPSSFYVIRVAAIIDLFTFSTYSATAVVFSVFSFVGAWMLFLTFDNKYPHLHKWMAFATLFIPSVFFWGSGLLKDTIVLSSLGAASFAIDRLFLQRRISIGYIIILILSLYLIYSVKKFVLQAYLPAMILWIYISYIQSIKSLVVRMLIFPFIVGVCALFSYFLIVKVGEADARYSLAQLGQTAKTTAIDIRYQSGKDAGSGYSLGDLDGSLGGMFKLAPQAINVALFRPYLWEVNNVLMLLSSLESLGLLLFTALILYKKNTGLFKKFRNPEITFSFVFSMVFAFAVGVSTFNFGTLARYKIPLLPFYLICLILFSQSNNETNLEELDDTE